MRKETEEKENEENLKTKRRRRRKMKKRGEIESYTKKSREGHREKKRRLDDDSISICST